MARNAIATKADTAALIKSRLERNKDRVKVSTGNKIKLSKKKRAFEVNGQFHPTIGAVLVEFAYFNRYDIRPFKEGDPTPPDCWALNSDEDEMVPDPACPSPQAESCKACPQNVFDDSIGRKPCRNKIRLALLPVGENDKEIMILEAPPTSATPLKKVLMPIIKAKKDFAAFTYEFEYDQESEYPKFLTECTGDNPDYEGTLARAADADTALQVSYDYSEAPTQKATVKKSTRRTTRRK